MRGAILFLVLLACLTAVAEEKTPQQRVDQRRAEIEKKKEQDRAEEYAKLALDLTAVATEQYNADRTVEADRTAGEIAQAAADSVQSARLKRKHVKQAEIRLRECSRLLDELNHRLPSTDRDAVTKALEAVENARSQLLEVMFGK